MDANERAHIAGYWWLQEHIVLTQEYNRRGLVTVMPTGWLGFNPDDVLPLDNANVQLNNLCRATRYSTWRGLDVRHTRQSPDENAITHNQFDVFAALQPAADWGVLTQATFDFITLSDQPGAQPDLWHSKLVEEEFDTEWARLMQAWRKDLIAEAAPFRNGAIHGAFVLQHQPLKKLDSLVSWSSLRLVVSVWGIVGSIVVDGHGYAPFCWTPEGICTVAIWTTGEAVFSLDVLLAGIWRDACVVREKWVQRTIGSISVKSGGSKPVLKSAVQLPRVVYKSSWGSVTDQDNAERIRTQAHTVRGSYVQLPEGYQSHDANERAEQFGYPSPPAGYTFRKPHVRGEGRDTVQATMRVDRVACRGLQSISVLLG